MHSHLVSSSGFWARFYKGCNPKTLQDPNARQGRLSPRTSDRALPAPNSCPKRLVCNHLLPLGLVMNNGMVYLLHLAPLELQIQGAVSLGAARQDHHPAGLAIQAVHDPKFPVNR